ncbi:MAG TPA: sigma-70 family RNA polymerase sigma factor [Planctomycetota bacterium]|nr:sigma-70 family RNA polymerase sigma factor [Planctomycetota bacterium]
MSNETSVNAASDDAVRLISRIRTGSRDAFTELVRGHQARVRSYLGRFLRDGDIVDDLAQETFIAAFRSLDTFKQQANLGSWLLGIARNLALKHLRDEQRRRSRETDSLEIAFSRWSERRLESEESSLQRHEQVLEALRTCIGGLQKQSAGILRDTYVKGRSAAEIANDLGKTEGTIWVTLMRIRQSLRDCIGEKMARAGIS